MGVEGILKIGLAFDASSWKWISLGFCLDWFWALNSLIETVGNLIGALVSFPFLNSCQFLPFICFQDVVTTQKRQLITEIHFLQW